MRTPPSWNTIIAMASAFLAAVCMIAVLLLAWVVQHLWTGLETERVYRDNSRERTIELLTAIEHSSCDDIDALRESVQRIREDMTKETP